jgi:nucleoid DNA-binding protein
MEKHSANPEGSPPVLSPELVDELVEVLIRDGRLQIDDFGVFELRIHKPRKGRNPRTGQRITIPRKLRVAFRACRVLRDRLDEELARIEQASADATGATTENVMPKKHWWQFWK